MITVITGIVTRMPLAALPKGDKVSDMTLHRTGLEKAEVFQKVYDTVTAAYHGVVKT